MGWNDRMELDPSVYNFEAGDIAEFTGDRGQKYVVTCGKNGNLYCNCPAWKFQNKHPKDRMCKHVKSLIEIVNYEEDKCYERDDD